MLPAAIWGFEQRLLRSPAQLPLTLGTGCLPVPTVEWFQCPYCSLLRGKTTSVLECSLTTLLHALFKRKLNCQSEEYGAFCSGNTAFSHK